jgi:hypothetical protein
VRRAALAAAALLAAAGAGAEVRRVEVWVPLAADAGAAEPDRQALLQQAVAQAVGGVARAVLAPEAAAGLASDAAAAALLPEGPAGYALRYQVLGEGVLPPAGEGGPALAGGPEAAGLRVEVHVDAGRVAAALRERGLALAEREIGPVEAFHLELRDLPSWGAYDRLRRHLLEQRGALEVAPELFEAGRAVLRVRAPGGAAALAARLAAAPPEGLRVEPLGVAGDVVALRVSEEPPLLDSHGAEALAPFDTPD